MHLTISNINTRTSNYCQTVRGTYEPLVTRIDVNGVEDQVTMTNGQWSFFVKLEAGVNTFELQPYSAGNMKLPTTRIDISVDPTVGEVVQPRNLLDEWAVLVGLDRRQNEKNSTFKQRILKFARLRKDNTTRGLSRILNLSLGLPESLRYLSLEVLRDANNSAVTEGAYARVTPTAFEITSSDMVTTEIVTVDPITLSASLSNKICERASESIKLIDASGNTVPSSNYFVDYFRNKLQFLKNEYNRSDVQVTYQRWHRELLSDHTIASLMGAVNSIAIGSTRLFSVAYLDDTDVFSSSESADILLPFPIGTTVRVKANVPASVLPNQDLVLLGAARVKIAGLSDNKSKYLNTRGTAYDAPLGSWAKVLIAGSQLTWSHVKFNESVWQSRKNPEHIDVLPHITNAFGTMYSRPSVVEELALSQLRALSYNMQTFDALTQYGIPADMWHSGVGTEGDLRADISEGRTISVEDLILAKELAKSSGLIGLGRTTDIDQLERINAVTG